ncbi:MAG: hypothetical protein DI536_16555 [Archangium gephyra]|uniref:Uncharacterized protein n=1 Tax=Archangium gephyra TaxID=48 RepID=A0A2W5T8V2_9BACT|nr:MAG: hypothetical protein DI536_16555 [Archangium gephyra]
MTCKLSTTNGNASYPGGYCTRTCTDDTVCGAGGLCVQDNSIFSYYGEPTSFCLSACPSAGSQSTCRSGYSCKFAENGQPGNCWLDPVPMPVAGNATSTGNACTQDSACQNPPDPSLGFCFAPTLPDGGASRFPQGYCTAECTYDLRGDFCGSNGTCIDFNNNTPNDPADDYGLCLRNCTTPGGISNCRSGYTCQNVGLPSGGVCFPP